MKGRAGSPQCCERAGEAADRWKAGSRGGGGKTKWWWSGLRRHGPWRPRGWVGAPKNRGASPWPMGHGNRVSVWARQHGNNNSAFQSFTVGSLGCGSHMQVGRSYAHPGTPVEFPFSG